MLDAGARRVVLDRSALHPGGGGQVSDVGWLDHAGGRCRSSASRPSTASSWHVLGDAVEPRGTVVVRVDADHRSRVAQLHTDSHILNALVYDRFPGTLVDRRPDQRRRHRADGLRPVGGRQRRAARPRRRRQRRDPPRRRRAQRLRRRRRRRRPWPGSCAACRWPRRRRRDGRLRVIDIDGVDRQACGGTHLSNTGQSRPFRITKVESKGKRNRRIRFVARRSPAATRGNLSPAAGGVPRSWTADSSSASTSCHDGGYRAGYAVLGTSGPTPRTARRRRWPSARPLGAAVARLRRRRGWHGCRRTWHSTGSRRIDGGAGHGPAGLVDDPVAAAATTS